jgi:hypothetical protein
MCSPAVAIIRLLDFYQILEYKMTQPKILGQLDTDTLEFEFQLSHLVALT